MEREEPVITSSHKAKGKATGKTKMKEVEDMLPTVETFNYESKNVVNANVDTF